MKRTALVSLVLAAGFSASALRAAPEEAGHVALAATGEEAPRSATEAQPLDPVKQETQDPKPQSEGKPLGPPVRPKKLPPLPDPNAKQVADLLALESEVAAYAEAARDYQKTLSVVVKHHYEERRRRILEAYDEEIHQRREEVDQARADAIEALERFVATYSGENSHPEATPDAMFRLAALYEERARLDFDADLGRALEPAIALYRQILSGFESYEERAGVAYYLGHAFTDAGRLEEGQQAWRSLVCWNKYPLRGVEGDPVGVQSVSLAQDHDERFWNEWYNKHPLPFDQVNDESVRTTDKMYAKREELTFRDPYSSCEAIAQDVPEGEEPRYVAETWWQIGNYHFDQLDRGGPYSLNRAMSAYERSMEYKKPPLYGVAMYKRAWTYFKQQRYHTAVNWFINLLHYADRQEEETGDPGADFRAEAYTYIAGSLTYVDFEGPPAADPFIPRNDVLDVELDPVVAEEKMAIAIRRVQDPELIPQDKKWTVEIYKALGQEFIDITQNRNAIAVFELSLDRYPLDRDAPKIRDQVANLYDQLARLAPDGSAVRQEYAQKALQARTRLADYVGSTPWTQANRLDPEALQQAEQLAQRGLRRAAADHTNRARAWVARAEQASSEEEQRSYLDQAIEGYRLAEKGWGAYIEQDPAALDSYESRFWLADARYWIVVLQLSLGRTPATNEVDSARAAAVDVRDSTEDDRYLQPAAYYLVSMSDNLLTSAQREFQASNGAHGVEPRQSVQFVGTGAERKPEKAPIPLPVQRVIYDRDGYNASISFEDDPQRNGPQYAFQAAEYYFVYGHFDEARARFRPMMEEYCGRNEWGYQAWEKLISMSNFEGDVEQSRQLAEGRSCAFDADTRAAEEALRTPVRQGVAYLDARKVYDQAEQMPEGPERDAMWRKAAAAYKVALDAAPDRDEAPEAAMNGAFAYKQVGEYDKAIGMYELFISRYGNDKKLRQVREGDPNADPPIEARPEKYEERVGFLKMAYDALASSYVLFFNYPEAASTFEKISATEHFAEADRREAARQSLTLAASLADEPGMRSSRRRFAQLGASAEELAEADFVIASSALKQWDPLSPDRGANRNARAAAERAMISYFQENKDNPAAVDYIVEAAYWVARTKHAAKDARERNWWNETQASFEKYRAKAPKNADGVSSALGSRQANFAAEAAFIELDEHLQKTFDYETGHHRFAGTTVEVLEQYRKGAAEAQKEYEKLQRVIDDYASPQWATAALARQGSLYDSLRTALYNTLPPALKMFDKKTDALLRRAENSDSLELQEKADTIRTSVENAWREARDRELAGADQVMVDRYGNAITLARRYNQSNPAVERAIQRLAFFTEVIGEAKLGQYTERVKGLEYTPGLFLRLRPGLVTAPKPNGLTPPAPEALQGGQP